MKRRPRPVPPWEFDPHAFEVHELGAVKAMALAHPKAFAIVCDKIAGCGHMSFAAGGEDGRRATDFAEGRRWVGITLRAIVAVKLPGASGEQP